MSSRIRPALLIVTSLWAYVTVSNVLYANRMQASLTALHVEYHFVPWAARLLQHLALYPVLLGCVGVSGRLGWQPILRRLPLQGLIGIGFAVLATPTLMLSEWVMGDRAALHVRTSSLWGLGSGALIHVWTASATNFLLTYGFALALVAGFDFSHRLRESQVRTAALERELGAAQLAALRMQLSPHSLFNLLHAIRGQIDWDPAAARSMIVQLGELLRRLLNAGEREFSLLAEEIQFARTYLELQQRRFPDRLTLKLPEPAELPVAWVPSLILQPLIENAVVHGLAGHSEPVLIRLQVCASHGQLTLRVVNTMAKEGLRRESGIGLRNVRDRLDIQFGRRACFSAATCQDRQWAAEIRMPLLAEGLDRAVAQIGSA